MNCLGIESLYHSSKDEEFGDESSKTLIMKNSGNRYHHDFAFIPSENSTNFSLLSMQDYEESDHSAIFLIMVTNHTYNILNYCLEI